MKKFIVTAHGSERVRFAALVKGETVKLEIDWNNYLGMRSSATVSSSAWASDDGCVTVASAANSGGVTSVLATGVSVGEAIVKNTATLSNSEILVRKFRVRVLDPETDSLTDYQ